MRTIPNDRSPQAPSANQPAGAAASKRVIRVFASSPGDVDAERNALAEVVAAINRIDGERDRFVMELFKWEDNVVPKIGPKPQEVVDQQTPSYEIYLGIMSARFGGGGTIKEFRDALQNWSNSGSPWILFYFNDNRPNPQTAAAGRELLKVLEFREELETYGIVGSYESVRGSKNSFYEKTLEHLRKIVYEWLSSNKRDQPALIRPDYTKYLQSLRSETEFIDIRGLGVGTGKAHQFRIDELYITLTSHAPLEPEERQPLESREQPLEAVLARHHHLVVVGGPGSGKTTFLKRLGFALVQYHQGGAPSDVNLTSLLAERPFPIFLRVAALTKYFDTSSQAQAQQHAMQTDAPPQQDDAARWLPYVLGKRSADEYWGLDEAFFRDQLEAGCTVLIDGLDEASDRRVRERVSRLIEKWRTTFNRCRFVVTSRPTAYRDQVVLAGFAEARIDPLSTEAVNTFLTKWCGRLHHDEQMRKRHLDELLEALHVRPEIRRMARNPVMLTALAVVHWNEKRLPEQRAELYEAIIRWLSRAREQRPGRETAERTVVLLQTLALEMQQVPQGRLVQVTQRWATETLARGFASPEELAMLDQSDADEGQPNQSPPAKRQILRRLIEKAESFLHAEEIDSGIIVGRGNELAFWHLTFQEYLAARAIAAEVEEGQQEILFSTDLNRTSRLFQSEWREMVTLLAGTLYEQGVAKVDKLITQIIDCSQRSTSAGRTGTKANSPIVSLADQARCVGLIGLIERDLTPVDYRVKDGRYPAILQSVQAIFDPTRYQQVPVQERIAAGDALGQAGDLRLNRRSEAYWVTIPGETYWLGAQKTDSAGRNYDAEAYGDEGPVHQVQLDSFQIAKYPLTVGEYREFIDNGGYEDEQCWKAGGFSRFSSPAGWDTQQDYLSRPVVGVSWYEAQAFCSWSGRYRLPTEAEWEAAARGREGRRYPWGNTDPQPNQINFQAKIGHPTPVGIFPGGSTPEGLVDMAGNVWEWCADARRDYGRKSERHPRGPSQVGSRVIRGGSWDFHARSVRCAYRLVYSVVYRDGRLGFRLVRVQE